MRWVHKEKSLFTLAVALLVIGGVLFYSSRTDTSDQKIASVIIEESTLTECFDLSALSSIKTSAEKCPDALIYLGDQPLSEILNSDGVVEALHPVLQKRFDVAQAFARGEGVDLQITSGFRSLARQEALFARAISEHGDETEAAKWVLPPQFSHHPKGLAIDVNYPYGPESAEWLERNGWRFGLCRVYANEWWHFEGVIAPGQSCPAPAPNALVDRG